MQAPPELVRFGMWPLFHPQTFELLMTARKCMILNRVSSSRVLAAPRSDFTLIYAKITITTRDRKVLSSQGPFGDFSGEQPGFAFHLPSQWAALISPGMTKAQRGSDGQLRPWSQAEKGVAEPPVGAGRGGGAAVT